MKALIPYTHRTVSRALIPAAAYIAAIDIKFYFFTVCVADYLLISPLLTCKIPLGCQMKRNRLCIPNRTEIIKSILFKPGRIERAGCGAASGPSGFSQIIDSRPEVIAGNKIMAGCVAPKRFMMHGSVHIIPEPSLPGIIPSYTPCGRIFRSYHAAPGIFPAILLVKGFRPLSPSSHIVIAHYIQRIFKLPESPDRFHGRNVITGRRNHPAGILLMAHILQCFKDFHSVHR